MHSNSLIQIYSTPNLEEEINPLLPSVMSSAIEAGFPSPADDYKEGPLDLNRLVIKQPAATFYVRVRGESMRGAGIRPGDILVVDRSVEPTHGKIVIAIYQGEFTVKRLSIHPKGVTLLAEHPAYPPIDIIPESDFQVWGVVTYVIHKAV